MHYALLPSVVIFFQQDFFFTREHKQVSIPLVNRKNCFARHNKQAHSALACRKSCALDKVAKGCVADGD